MALAFAGSAFGQVPRLPCIIQLSSNSFTATATGGAGSVSFAFSETTPGACGAWGWSAVSNAVWITNVTPAGGAGANIGYVVLSNPGAPRTGIISITISNKEGSFNVRYQIDQGGAACSYTVSPKALVLHDFQTTRSVTVTASGSYCQWTSASNNSWLTIASGGTVAGSGSVTVSVAANTGEPRNGTLTVAGQTVTVSQDNTPVISTASPLSDANVGASYSLALQAEGNTPFLWSVSGGGMPPGLGINGTTGVISGKPTAARVFTFSVELKDVAGKATMPFRLTVNGSLSNSPPSSLTLPGPAMASIALASAINFQLMRRGQWKDYGSVIIIMVLDELAKAASNSGQPISTATYNSVAIQVRAVLDANPPTSRGFPDAAACLRYAIDTLLSPRGGPSALLNAPAARLLPVALAKIGNVKFTRLELSLSRSSNRQYPAELGLASVAPSAYAVIADYIQEAADLAHNDGARRRAVNAHLLALCNLDTSASVGQIQSQFPGTLPELPSPNTDGTFTLVYSNLLDQYSALIRSFQAQTDKDLSDLKAISGGALAQASADARATSNRLSNRATPGDSPGCTAGETIVRADQCTATKSTPPDYWSKAQSAVNGLSKVMGHFDSQAGKQIGAAGSGLISAFKAISQIQSILSGGFSLATAMSLATPAGALLGQARRFCLSLPHPAGQTRTQPCSHRSAS